MADPITEKIKSEIPGAVLTGRLFDRAERILDASGVCLSSKGSELPSQNLTITTLGQAVTIERVGEGVLTIGIQHKEKPLELFSVSKNGAIGSVGNLFSNTESGVSILVKLDAALTMIELKRDRKKHSGLL